MNRSKLPNGTSELARLLAAAPTRRPLHRRLTSRIIGGEELTVTDPQTPVAPLSGMQTYSLPLGLNGIDRRQAISEKEMLLPPYVSICLIRGRRIQGTGFLVGGNRIVTAAHVIDGAMMRDVQFPGHPPFRVAGPFRVSDEFRQPGDAFDYGIIDIHPQFIANIPPLAFSSASNAALQRCSCEVAGYPLGRSSMMRYPPWPNPEPFTCEIEVTGRVIRHRLDTTEGQSGAPILAWTRPDRSDLRAIGIHTFGDGDGFPGLLNRGVALAAGVA